MSDGIGLSNEASSAVGWAEMFADHPRPMAIATKDERVTAINESWQKLLPRNREFVAGETLSEAFSDLTGTGGHDGAALSLGNAISTGHGQLLPLVVAKGRVLVPYVSVLKNGSTHVILVDQEQPDKVGSQLNQILEYALDGFAAFDAAGNLLVCNTEFVGTVLGDPELAPPVGQHRSDIARRMFESGVLDASHAENFQAAAEAMVESFFKPDKVQRDIEAPDGRVINVSSIPAHSGGHVMVLRDVTDERRSDKKAIDTLTDAIDALEQGFAHYDENFRFLVCNEQYVEMICGDTDIRPYPGMDGAEFARMTFSSGHIILPDGVSIDRMIDDIAQWAAAGRKDIEFKLANGRILQCGYNRTALGGYIVTLLDITDQRKADRRALAALQESSEALVEGFSLWDEDFKFVLCNRRYSDLVFGDPDYRPKPGHDGFEVAREASQGTLAAIPDGMTVDEFAAQGFEAMKALQHGLTIERDDGRTIEFSCHRTKNGGHLITVLDITDRVNAAKEVERQRKIAFQTEKLSALGELLAGVAHELNNPLSIVVGYSQMLAEQITDPQQADKLARIASAAERSAKIVKTFLAMARQKPAIMEPIDMAEVIEGAMDVAAYGLRTAGGRIIVRCPPDLPLVMADMDQLIQVISNLIVNAEHALKEKGNDAVLRIEAAHEDRTVSLFVSDNGTGMSPDVQARIFEPFFTTKDVGMGTGFGLAFCHRIIASHGGELTVESAQRQGTVFTIALPAAGVDERAHSLTMIKEKSDYEILVVDDERDVAELLKAILEARGHRVECVFGSHEALERVEARSFDIVLSDMKMPGMMGDQLHARILDMRPDLKGKIGFITGDSLSEKVRNFLEAGGRPFIEKPIQVEELMKLIEKLGRFNGRPE